MKRDVVERLRGILDDVGVVTDLRSLEAAETATFQTTARIPLIVRPTCRDQVQEVFRLANEVGFSVYPVSTGKNWGYGSRVPTSDNCVLMELGRMNRILDFSEDQAYVTVEPGVTQQQLFDFLKDRGSRLLMDSTGASPQCSVVANTVERGFGHTPYGDHFTNACNFEVVLPNGECLETGYGRFDNIAATPVYRWGVGPILDGLFSQSNFGVVTRLTLWLMPKPEYFQGFFFSVSGQGRLQAVIDALRPLRLDGTLRSASHIGNDYKVISGIRQFPWDRTGGETPLRPEVLSGLAKEMQFGEWNGSGALYGSRIHVADARRRLKRALKGKVDRLTFLDDRLIAIARRFSGPCRVITGWDLSKTLDLVEPVYGLMRGKPTDYPLRSVYWRKKMPLPPQLDPDRDGCGLIWCAPVAPIDGRHSEQMTALARRVALTHGFEPMISITLLTERTQACVISLSYDRDVPGEDNRAMVCHREMVHELVTAGYHFYRLGIQMMREIEIQGSAYEVFLRDLKVLVDPRGVLSPGRYVPEPALQRVVDLTQTA